MALLVNDVTPSVQYTATAAQTAFAYPFAIFADSDLKVYKVSSSGEPNDTTDILILTTDYTVTGAGLTAGGTIVLVVGAATGDIVTIARDVAVERTTDYQNLGDLASESLNNDLDKLVMMVQQNEEAFGRSISLQASTQTPSTFNVDDPVAEFYAVAKADLSGIKWIQLLSAGDLSVSAFMQTVLDDATALEARTTLDVYSKSEVNKASTFSNNANGNPNISDTAFSVGASVVVNTWESVGATGSGADNIWTALDVVPTDADWIEVKSYHVGFSAGGSADTQLISIAYLRKDGGTQTAGTGNNITAVIEYTSAAGNARGSDINTLKVGIGSGSVFDVNYSNTYPTINIELILVGYGYN